MMGRHRYGWLGGEGGYAAFAHRTRQPGRGEGVPLPAARQAGICHAVRPSIMLALLAPDGHVRVHPLHAGVALSQAPRARGYHK